MAQEAESEIKTEGRELTEAQRQQRAEASYRHGGERAVKHLQDGGPLVGIAAELQRAVEAEIEHDGIVEVLRRRAQRHQAVADLFFGLILGAKDVEKADRYVQRFGWLNAKAFGMLREVRDMERARGGATLDGLLAQPVSSAGGDGSGDDAGD